MKPYVRAVALALCLGLAAALNTHDVALAADVAEAGKNIGDTARSWAGSLFAGGTAVAACFYGLQRKVGPTLVFAGVALLVGGFIFAPQIVQDPRESLRNAVLERPV